MSQCLNTFLPNRIIVLLHLLLIPSYMSSQNEDVLDSLQNLIRKEVTEGTNTFLPVALAYDSIAMLSGETMKMGKGKKFIGM